MATTRGILASIETHPMASMGIVSASRKGTFDEIELALEEALAEVRHRGAGLRRFTPTDTN